MQWTGWALAMALPMFLFGNQVAGLWRDMPPKGVRVSRSTAAFLALAAFGAAVTLSAVAVVAYGVVTDMSRG